jgi:hypothetical protein
VKLACAPLSHNFFEKVFQKCYATGILNDFNVLVFFTI